MDNAIFLPSALLGVFFILIYLYKIIKHKRPLNVAIVINSVLLASGVICGLALTLGCFFPNINTQIKDIKLYTFIAGLAVLFVSYQGLHTNIIKIGHEK